MRSLEIVLKALEVSLGHYYLPEQLVSLKVAFALKVTASSAAPVQPLLGPLVGRIEALCGPTAECKSSRGSAAFYCDSNGYPAGFYTWGLLDDATELKLLQIGVDAVERVPGNGDRAWIFDAAVGPSGTGQDVLDAIRHGEAISFNMLGYQRVARGKRLSKRANAARLLRLRSDYVPHEPVPLDLFLRADQHLHLVANAFDELALIGAAARLLAKTRQLAKAPVQFVETRLNLALLLKQHQLVLDADGRPESFLSWFWLSDEVLRSAQAKPQAVLYGLLPTQWNEGRRIVLADVACRSAETATRAAERWTSVEGRSAPPLDPGLLALHPGVQVGDPSSALGPVLWALSSPEASALS